jgi:peptidyl-prolyl cis-trans isomerase-like 2
MWRPPRRCPLLRRTLSSYQDPFDEYKVRLAKKLAKKAEAQNSLGTQPATAEKKPGDGMNWFGVKLGAEDATGTSGGGGSGLGGVGKYLSLKRPPETAAVVAEHPKRKKTGFGGFENF